MRWWAELSAAIAAVALLASGVMLRRRRSSGGGNSWWSITIGSRKLEVMGPFRNEAGEVFAMRPSEQIEWADDEGGRLPTQAEFDQIWVQATVQVLPVPRDVVTAPLNSLNKDVNAALEAAGVDTNRIAAGKTWLSEDDNYGWDVNESDTAIGDDGIRRITSGAATGIEVFPTTVPDVFSIQPVSDFHAGTDHVDYSQLGYIVR